jgi:glycosyltransferase involved in cell wall biosynthesis
MTDERANVWLIIPAYNVASYLGEVLEQASRYIPSEKIVVVDDGSTDGIRSVKQLNGVVLLTHQVNRGKGAALLTGIEYVSRAGGMWVITLDGDGQHDPSRIPEFTRVANSDQADLIIGYRRRSGTAMPWDRRFSNCLSSWLLSRITGRKLLDVQCGYRMIRLSLIQGMVFSTTGYEFEAELLLKSIRRSAQVAWVEIPTSYSGSPSSIHRGADTLKFIRVVWRFLLGKL